MVTLYILTINFNNVDNVKNFGNKISTEGHIKACAGSTELYKFKINMNNEKIIGILTKSRP